MQVLCWFKFGLSLVFCVGLVLVKFLLVFVLVCLRFGSCLCFCLGLCLSLVLGSGFVRVWFEFGFVFVFEFWVLCFG